MINFIYLHGPLRCRTIACASPTTSTPPHGPPLQPTSPFSTTRLKLSPGGSNFSLHAKCPTLLVPVFTTSHHLENHVPPILHISYTSTASFMHTGAILSTCAQYLPFWGKYAHEVLGPSIPGAHHLENHVHPILHIPYTSTTSFMHARAILSAGARYQPFWDNMPMSCWFPQSLVPATSKTMYTPFYIFSTPPPPVSRMLE
jgi:hypothetical protein